MTRWLWTVVLAFLVALGALPWFRHLLDEISAES
jgi:hypothetical protein